MADVGFYHVTHQSPLAALARLMEKAHGQGLRALVRVAAAARVKEVDDYLWTHDPESFLPHGTARNEYPELQPIYIAEGEAAAPNGATLLVLLDNVAPTALEGFDRVLYLFDGRDDDQVAMARAHWRDLKAQGHTLKYWQQQDGGGWSQAA